MQRPSLSSIATSGSNDIALINASNEYAANSHTVDFDDGEQDGSGGHNKKKKKDKKKTGGFQSFGLCGQVFKGIMKMGFKVPTPIQRKAIPTLLTGVDV